jgi:hypothetical protein
MGFNRRRRWGGPPPSGHPSHRQNLPRTTFSECYQRVTSWITICESCIPLILHARRLDWGCWSVLVGSGCRCEYGGQTDRPLGGKTPLSSGDDLRRPAPGIGSLPLRESGGHSLNWNSRNFRIHISDLPDDHIGPTDGLFTVCGGSLGLAGPFIADDKHCDRSFHPTCDPTEEILSS